MTYLQIGSLLLFLLPLAYSPGPGNLAFAATAASSGFSATVLANLGYHIATLATSLLIGFSYNSLVSNSPELMLIITYIGSGYIIYLGIKFLMASSAKFKLKATKLTFVDGVVLLVTNPKGYFIMALMFSQFTPNSSQNEIEFIIMLCLIFTLNNCVAFIIWAFSGAVITTIFSDPKAQKVINFTFGMMLIIVAIGLITN